VRTSYIFFAMALRGFRTFLASPTKWTTLGRAKRGVLDKNYPEGRG